MRLRLGVESNSWDGGWVLGMRVDVALNSVCTV